jgi:hypothetical protein
VPVDAVVSAKVIGCLRGLSGFRSPAPEPGARCGASAEVSAPPGPAGRPGVLAGRQGGAGQISELLPT